MSDDILNTQNTPKLFFYLAIAMISLACVCFSSLTISFELIEYFSSNSYEKWKLATNTRFPLSVLIISLPTLYLSFYGVKLGIGQAKFSLSSKLFTWMIYIALVISVIVAIIDWSCLVYWFLAGELTTITNLKIGAVAIAAFFTISYLVMLLKNTSGFIRYILVGTISLTLLVMIALTFKEIPSISDTRMKKNDIEQTRMLIDLYSDISKYYDTSKSLPADLNALGAKGYRSAQQANKIKKENILYKLTDQNNFELCAKFNYESFENTRSGSYYYDNSNGSFNRHKQGDNCFKFNLQPDNKGHSFKRVD
ncbi:MAG: hypothetical protein RIT35_176 [Pseudomonadota bacterium]|jgi:hypothetical protein